MVPSPLPSCQLSIAFHSIHTGSLVSLDLLDFHCELWEVCPFCPGRPPPAVLPKQCQLPHHIPDAHPQGFFDICCYQKQSSLRFPCSPPSYFPESLLFSLLEPSHDSSYMVFSCPFHSVSVLTEDHLVRPPIFFGKACYA